MFNKTHFNQLATNIEKDDYLALTVFGPAKIEARKTVNGMTQLEISDAFKAYDVHYLGRLESAIASTIIQMKFDIYKIEWN